MGRDRVSVGRAVAILFFLFFAREASPTEERSLADIFPHDGRPLVRSPVFDGYLRRISSRALVASYISGLLLD